MRALAIRYLFAGFGIPDGPIKNLDTIDLFAAQRHREMPVQRI